MKARIILAVLLVCSVACTAQSRAKNTTTVVDAEYNIDLKLPQRLIRMSSNETTIRYQDVKSKAILEINRNRFSEFSGQNSAEAELLYIDKLGDVDCFEVTQTSFPVNVGECQMVSWKTKSSATQGGNDQNSKAMLEVGGTTYDFHIMHPSINEKDVNSLFSKILKSIRKSNKRG